jgi:7-carboxy-7-deazaguanine synthase
MSTQLLHKPILISEIFGPVIQGEGALIGRPTVFVRTGGCDYRCQWCDTLYAVLPEHRNEWTKLAPEEVLREVLRLSGGNPILVTLSGGNPALQPLEPLMEMGHAQGFSFAMETQGSVCQPWFAELDYLVLSPKPPSSGMTTNWQALEECVQLGGAKAGLKVVVFDEADYRFAREVHQRFSHVPFVLQCGTEGTVANDADEYSIRTGERINWLLERTVRDAWHNVTILPQLHVLLWGSKRGV